MCDDIVASVLAIDPLDHAARAEAVEFLESHRAAPSFPVAVPYPAERSPLTSCKLAWLRGDCAIA